MSYPAVLSPEHRQDFHFSIKPLLWLSGQRQVRKCARTTLSGSSAPERGFESCQHRLYFKNPMLPQQIAQMDTQNRILNLAQQGLSVDEIVTVTGLSVDMVRNHLQTIRADLTLRLQEAQEGWIALNLARMDKMISKVMPVFDRAAPNMDDPTIEGELKIKSHISLIGDAAKIYLSIAKMQKDILQLKIDSPNTEAGKFVQNNTFIADSDYFQVALQHIQVEKTGQTWDEYMEQQQEYIDVTPALEDNDQINRVEAKINRLLPETHEEETDFDPSNFE